MIYFARLEDALLNTKQHEIVALMSINGYDAVPMPSLFPVPAIPIRTVIADSYVFVEHINDNRLCFYSDNSGFPDLWASEVIEVNFGASR